MNEVSIVGLDIAKSVFEVHGRNEAGAVVVKRSLKRSQVEKFFGGLPKSNPTVELDTNHLHYKELLVVGTTASTVEDCRRAVELVTRGVVDTSWMVSHRLGLADVAAAVAAAQDPTALKVLVDPTLDTLDTKE